MQVLVLLGKYSTSVTNDFRLADFCCRAPFFIKTVSGDQIVKLVSGTANASDSLKDFTHEFSVSGSSVKFLDVGVYISNLEIPLIRSPCI